MRQKVLVVFFMFSFLTHAQDLQKVDSLNVIIKDLVEKNDWKLLLEAYFEKGKLYYKEREDAEAPPLYLKVDSISKKYNYINESTILATIHRAKISRNTFSHDGTENANALLLEALKIAEDTNNEKCIYIAYKELAYTKGLKGEYSEAKRYTDLAFPYYYEIEDYANISWLYGVYKNYYYAVDSLDKAKNKLKEQLAYFRTKPDSLQIAQALYDVAGYYRRKEKNCNQALPYLKEAKIIYEKTDNTKERAYLYLLETMAICNAELSQFETGYNFYKEAYNLRKKIVREANDNLTRELEAKHQAKEKAKEIELLTSQNELAEQQKTNQRNMYLAGLIITSFAGLFFFFQYRNRQKTNKKLRELDTAKSSFFTNISHEFRTPLTLIQSPIEEELQKETIDSEQRQKFKLIKRNSNRLLTLVDQLLILSKVESKALHLQTQEVNITEFISAMASSFEYGFKKKQIDFKAEIASNQKGYLDIDFVEKMVTNVLSNALKYAPEQGEVKLYSHIEGKELKLSISNTGQTLTEEELERIFKKFYQVNTKQQGYGIGLTLVKELVEIHKGRIDVSSNDNKVVFNISLPISRSSYINEEILETARPLPSMSVVEIESDEGYQADEDMTSDLPILLIVEDNQDMRQFTRSLFKNDYEVIEAEHGKEGIEKAIAYIPDIIISDVMMPETDGITLVDTLKNDQRTSHIPTILLSAKAEDEDKIKGILTGADDYITKPFNPKLIHAKVDTLLKNRDKAKAHYSHEVQLKPALFSSNSSEDKFFTKLQTVIDEQLQDPEFNVDAFSQLIGMSRMQLHRKLKATLGISASEFLRTERLKAARHLLLTSDLSISEIAYSIGFNDANYFSKSFKGLFSQSPTEYREQSNS